MISASILPGRGEMMITRSESCTASEMSWVTNKKVFPVLVPGHGVQSTQGFVHQHQGWIGYQGPAKGRTLLHAPG